MKISRRREPKGYGALGLTWTLDSPTHVLTINLGRRRLILTWRDRDFERIRAGLRRDRP